MNAETKTKLIEALEQYMRDHEVTQSYVAEAAGVNASYLVQMRKGVFNTNAGGRTVEIADKYFKRIGDLIGFSAEKQYWPKRSTAQMVAAMAGLVDARNNAEVIVIGGVTGSGKTTTVDLFKSKYPGDVYTVKIGSSDNLSDLIDKVLEALNIEAVRRTKSSRLRQIANHMKKLNENGHDPCLIFDEGEFAKQPALCAIKELYDILIGWCALALVGTPDMIENIKKMVKRNKPGMAQFWRRIKFKTIILPAIDRNFNGFLDGIEPGLKRWLKNNCENYGELADVLIPAMREADRTGSELNEDFVKLVLGI